MVHEANDTNQSVPAKTSRRRLLCLTGAGMVMGFVCGSTRRETFEGDAKLAHRLLHRVYDRFQEEYGTVLCEDVRKGSKADCPAVVGLAAQWTAEVLLEEFTDYAPIEQPAPRLTSLKEEDQ